MNNINLFSLNKKRLIVKHELKKEELDNIMHVHNMKKEQVQIEIQKQLYDKLLEGVKKNIFTSVTPNPEGDEIYQIEGYVLSQLNLFELIQEICDLDAWGRDILSKKVSQAIKYRPKNSK